jgi:DNA-binding transcriptional regulator YhcF (GntR family)
MIYKGLTMRAIAQEIDRSFGTVQQVVAVLKDEGLVVTERPKGTYLTEKGFETIERMGLGKR